MGLPTLNLRPASINRIALEWTPEEMQHAVDLFPARGMGREGFNETSADLPHNGEPETFPLSDEWSHAPDCGIATQQFGPTMSRHHRHNTSRKRTNRLSALNACTVAAEIYVA
jgi:hypothetical protein